MWEVSEAVVEATEELNRLDGSAGDGDLGLTMAAAARALQTVLAERENEEAAALLRQCGSEIARKAPSTSGTLVATGFLRAATELGEAGESERDVVLLARAVAAATEGIRARGKASPGDKTMLDALVPVTERFQLAADGGEELAAALNDGAQIAAQATEATASLRPQVGRASWMADRSVGHPDAGCHLISIGLTAAARAAGHA
ncbi:MAG: DAK2 domain-containing protein [Candidatus Dormibacteraeota bacterium]|nr:DAK2 domain-containing protein [Candidatus Dormibacteraeota bacterium]